MEQIALPSNVKTSTNYKSFKRLLGNRTKSDAHIKALRESIRLRPDLLPYKPILVNEKMEMIDGQHRQQICHEFGLPVYYTIGYGLTLKDAQLINQQQKNWTPRDFAKSFVELGDMNYQIYLDATDKFKLNHEIIMRFLGGTSATTLKFKEGDFLVMDKEKAYEQLEQLADMAVFYQRYYVRVFAYGFYQVVTSADYDHNRMLKQLRKYNSQLRDWGKPEGYARNLEDIFNAGQRRDNKPRLFGSNINLKRAFVNA